MIQKRVHPALQSATVCLLLLFSACDPEKVVNEYFGKAGLSRLAALRDDIEPGGLILVGKQGAIYADNMFDYVDQPPDDEREYGIVPGDGTTDFNAVLRQYTGDRKMEAGLALNFLKTVLPAPIGLESKIVLTNRVSIDLVNAKVRKMKIPAIQRFLGREESKPFRKYVKEQQRDAYLVYETWRTSKLKITAEAGKDVTSSLSVGELKPLLSDGKFNFTYKRTSKSELEISGDNFYVFAVRTAKLKPTPNSDSFAIEVTEFLYPKEWGIKGGDLRYAAPIPSSGPGITNAPIKFVAK